MEVLIRPWRRDDLPTVQRILWESWMDAYRAFIPVEDLQCYHAATYRIESLTHLYESPHVHGFIGEAHGSAGVLPVHSFTKMKTVSIWLRSTSFQASKGSASAGNCSRPLRGRR